MRLGYAIYVTREGAHDEDSTRAAMRELERALRTRLDDGTIAGYDLVAVVGDQDYADGEIDKEWVEGEAGPPPFVYATVSWDADDPSRGAADHEDVVKAFGLLRLLEAEQPR